MGRCQISVTIIGRWQLTLESHALPVDTCSRYVVGHKKSANVEKQAAEGIWGEPILAPPLVYHLDCWKLILASQDRCLSRIPG